MTSEQKHIKCKYKKIHSGQKEKKEKKREVVTTTVVRQVTGSESCSGNLGKVWSLSPLLQQKSRHTFTRTSPARGASGSATSALSAFFLPPRGDKKSHNSDDVRQRSQGQNMKQFLSNRGEGRADFCESLHRGRFGKFPDQFIREQLERPKCKIKSYIRWKSLNSRQRDRRVASYLSAGRENVSTAKQEVWSSAPAAPGATSETERKVEIVFVCLPLCACVYVVFWPPRRAAHADVVAADGRPPGTRSRSHIPPV